MKFRMFDSKLMKAKYYSTAELAEKTGNFRQVISAIINEKWKEKRISQATYERIKKAMDDLGFVPGPDCSHHSKRTVGKKWDFFVMVLYILIF